MKIISKLLSISLLILFLGSMFGILFHSSSHINMSDNMGMQNCPFMAHDSALCTMDLTSHVNAWKTTFLAIIPTFNIVFIALGALIFIVSFTSYLFSKSRYPTKIIFNCTQGYKNNFIYRPLQDLFSQGILHPKLF